jgi:hypothetical protein
VPQLAKCGVYSEDLADPLLKATYKKLVKLPGYIIAYTVVFFTHGFFRGKCNLSWKDAQHEKGMIMFSKWKDFFPKADLKCVYI